MLNMVMIQSFSTPCATSLHDLLNENTTKIRLNINPLRYLRFGLAAISLIAPAFSMIGNVAVSLIFFSASLTALVGDSERLVGYDGIAKALVGDAVGFFKSRRDGGGGASSASP